MMPWGVINNRSIGITDLQVICQIDRLVGNYPMPRELIWLENRAFVAWGCTACGWIISNPPSSSSNVPSREVKEAFNKHKCEEHPGKAN